MKNYRVGNLPLAKEYIDSTVRLNPGSVYAWSNKGLIEFRMERHDSAEASFSRALAKADSVGYAKFYSLNMTSDIFLKRARTREVLGDSAGALKDSLAAARHHQKCPDAVWWMKMFPDLFCD